MADLRLMSRDFVTEFIELYRQNECLWKIKTRDYRDRYKKQAAYNILINKLQEIDPLANKDSVLRKINSLRTCFRKEFKKYIASLRIASSTEDVPRPNLWYFNKLLFLTEEEMPRQDYGDNMEELMVNPICKVEPDVDITDEEDNIDVSEMYELPSPKSADSHASTSTSGIAHSSTNTESTTFRKRKRDSTDEVLNTMTHSFHSNKQARNETVGKFNVYAKHIAQELEELSPKMAIYCKKVINEAVYHGQLGNLTENSRVVNEAERVVSEKN